MGFYRAIQSRHMDAGFICARNGTLACMLVAPVGAFAFFSEQPVGGVMVAHNRYRRVRMGSGFLSDVGARSRRSTVGALHRNAWIAGRFRCRIFFQKKILVSGCFGI